MMHLEHLPANEVTGPLKTTRDGSRLAGPLKTTRDGSRLTGSLKTTRDGSRLTGSLIAGLASLVAGR